MDVTGSLDLGPVSYALLTLAGPIHHGRLLDGTEVAFETTFSWRQEVLAIWARCNHPNIVRLIGKATFQQRLVAVYGWHEYPSIREYLYRHPTVDCYQLISEGVAYLHSIGIINGSLDDSRIVVSRDGVPRIRLSILTSSTTMDPASSVWSAWKASELRRGGAKVSIAGDVFALGMTILYIIIWGGSDTNNAVWAVHEKVLRGEPPPRPTNVIPLNDAGNAIWDMLCKCWSLNPENRPSAKHVCDAMSSVYQSPDGVAFKSLRLVVREVTTVQDLVTHFESQGLMNYTQFLHPSVILSSSLVADTALANVYRVEMLYHEPVAVKCVKHTTPYKRLKRAARELSCWASHKHEHILPLFGFAIVGEDLAMVSPWVRNGCVTEYVIRQPSCDRLSLCTQLTQAIAYLHEHDVVHGDIKGPNVLISDEGMVQVTDFGVSIADHQDIEFSTTSVGGGTQRWQAPEILRGESDSNAKADVYALGMTFTEIYTGERPYNSMNLFQTIHRVINGTLRPSRPVTLPIDTTGNKLWELMNVCWAGDPNDRPTASEVYNWLRTP